MSDTLLDPRRTPTDPRFARLLELSGDYKAELVDDEVHIMSPSGRGHNRASFAIARSLFDHARRTGVGEAFGDSMTFLVDIPGRESFSPDAAYLTGPAAAPGDMSLDAVDAPPTFAVEVRSKNDYGPRRERKLAAKRADYFTAGTQVVWDVDVIGDDTIRVYRPDAPESPAVFRRGEVADAEPAVPGWRFPVDELFR